MLIEYFTIANPAAIIELDKRHGLFVRPAKPESRTMTGVIRDDHVIALRTNPNRPTGTIGTVKRVTSDRDVTVTVIVFKRVPIGVSKSNP